MQSVFNIALPFFALIFTGYFAARSGLLGEKTVGGLNTFVFYFALPALLLVTTYESPTPDGAVFGLLASYYLPSFALFFAVLLLGRRLFGLRLADAAIQSLGATFSNVGFIGLPLIILLYGSAAALPAVLIVMVDSIVMLGWQQPSLRLIWIADAATSDSSSVFSAEWFATLSSPLRSWGCH